MNALLAVVMHALFVACASSSTVSVLTARVDKLESLSAGGEKAVAMATAACESKLTSVETRAKQAEAAVQELQVKLDTAAQEARELRASVSELAAARDRVTAIVNFLEQEYARAGRAGAASIGPVFETMAWKSLVCTAYSTGKYGLNDAFTVQRTRCFPASSGVGLEVDADLALQPSAEKYWEGKGRWNFSDRELRRVLGDTVDLLRSSAFTDIKQIQKVNLTVLGYETASWSEAGGLRLAGE